MHDELPDLAYWASTWVGEEDDIEGFWERMQAKCFGVWKKRIGERLGNRGFGEVGIISEEMMMDLETWKVNNGSIQVPKSRGGLGV